MLNKSLRPNVIPSTAIAAAGTLTSQVQPDRWGRGIRFYVTVSAVTTGGGTDSLYLCGVPPGNQPVAPALLPVNTLAVPLSGFAGVNMLAVAGTYVFDFYPGGALPPTGLAGSGVLLGVMAAFVPVYWAVRVVLGAGNAATVVIGAEILP